MLKLFSKSIKSNPVITRRLAVAQKTASLLLIVAALMVFAPTGKTDSESPTTSTAEVATAPLATSIQMSITSAQADDRALRLQKYLTAKGSPLANYAVDFVSAADKNGLDWKLLPAMSGVESSFGLRYPYGTYNAWGWGGGYIPFANWTDAINQMSFNLKDKYASRGAITVPQIAAIYDPVSPVWAGNVQMYINQINGI